MNASVLFSEARMLGFMKNSRGQKFRNLVASSWITLSLLLSPCLVGVTACISSLPCNLIQPASDLLHESRGIVLALVELFSWGGGTSPPPECWPAPAPRDSELGLPLQIDLFRLIK